MICPVCKENLLIINNSYVCKNNHSYDIAKSGYVNLLLNNHHNGDNKDMIDARNVILKQNYFEPLANKLAQIIKSYQIKSILDVGCGEGYYDRYLSQTIPELDIWGMDISKYACEKASKLKKVTNCLNLNYVVASITSLPFSNESNDCILNVFAPLNEEEFHRVCKKYLIKVVPNENHLIELKNHLYENPYLNPVKELNLKGFIKLSEETLTYKKQISELGELLQMTPYYYKTNFNNDMFLNMCLDITCDFKILIYKRIELK